MDDAPYINLIPLEFWEKGLASLDQDHSLLVRQPKSTQIILTLLWIPGLNIILLLSYITLFLIHLLLLPFSWPFLLFWVYILCEGQNY